MHVSSLQDWPTLLRRTAALTPPPSGGTLHLGPLEAPLRRALGLPAADSPASPGPERVGPETEFWRSRAEGEPPNESALDANRPTLLPTSAFDAIEVFTDAELSALHALWWLLEAHPHASWRARMEAVRDWHLLHTQPDNATNRPWAIHVFAEAETPEAMLYAQTLLHNAIALEGRPTPLGAAILRDAADALERIVARR